MCGKVICLVSSVLALIMAGNASADLVAHWGFDETSGSVVHDISGNGHDGTINGTADWVPGQVSGALHFDGSTYVDVPDEIGTFPTFSVALWFKYDSFIANWNSIWHNDAWQAGWLHHMVTNYAGQDIRVQFAINGAGDQFGVTPIETGLWYHSTVTYDSTTGQMNFYLTTDAEKKVNLDVALTVSGPATIITAGQIGGWEGNRLSSATFDDIRMYDHILSEAEILSAIQGKAWPFAFGPNPEDGAMVEATWVSMSWQPGQLAVSHDVYMSDNFDDVNDGAVSAFQGNQGSTMFIAGFAGFAFPDGLVPGTTYYWRVDEVNDADPNSPWKGDVWSLWIPPKKAYEAVPADEARFIPADVTLEWTAGFNAKLHTVYFGDNYDEVESASGGAAQAATTFTPGTLELDKTYYWRVDEFDPPATHKGDVWSFTTLPDVPIADPDLMGWWTLEEGAGGTAVDWSGQGRHGTLVGDAQWVPGFDGGALEFDGASYVDTGYTENLAEWTIACWVKSPAAPSGASPSGPLHREQNYQFNWNHGNEVFRGAAAMNVGGTWHAAKYTPLQANRWYHLAATYDGSVFNAYRDGVLITSNSAPSGAANSESNSLKLGRHAAASQFFTGTVDEARVYNRALTAEEIVEVMKGDTSIAWSPNPGNGTMVEIGDALPLSWSAGDNASQHDVYFGTDKDAVANDDASDATGIYRGRQSTTRYNPPEGVEWGGGPYYWRIDESNTDGTIGKGKLWTFTVTDYLLVDDFEDYNNYPPDEIWNTWIDGFGDPTNGALVGYGDDVVQAGGDYTETTIVNSGAQSMPLFFDNNLVTSEATRTLTPADNWTREGVAELSLWIRGESANSAEPVYVALNGVAILHDDPAIAQATSWTEWRIPLSAFADGGVNLAAINTVSVGLGDKNNITAGGSGVLYVDDIRLVR